MEMETVCEKDKCTGCMACVSKCPVKAIQIVDSVKAYNSIIDTDKCIKCGLCYKVCQVNNSPILNYPKQWKQGWIVDNAMRMKSSSGGVAAELSRLFIAMDGVVCSCSSNEEGFIFETVDNVNDLHKFSGSKYVKSNPLKAYSEIDNELKQNKSVLFIGLPCQCAAIKNYFNNNDRIYTVDVICHGTPSPILLDKYLVNEEQAQWKEKHICFRDKNTFFITLDGNRVNKYRKTDYYTVLFLNSTIYTENCYQCSYAGIERVADITLGDSWGTCLPKNEQERGISLILCNTDKGTELLKKAKLQLFDVSLEDAVKNNAQLREPSKKSPARDKFFSFFSKGYSFNECFFRCYRNERIKDVLKKTIHKLKRGE